jgi:hypothetical protein
MLQGQQPHTGERHSVAKQRLWEKLTATARLFLFYYFKTREPNQDWELLDGGTADGPHVA